MNYTIELDDDSNLAITKGIYDITQPDKRKSNFTKTIIVPSSAENDQIFASQFDVNFSLDDNTQFAPYFNPNKKAPCNIHTDTIEQVTGYAQLTDIVLNRYSNKVEYKLTIYGEIRDLWAELSNKTLADLDLSEYNHTYNETNIEASWSNTSGYLYPMVDYGDNHQNYDTGTLINDFWITEHFKPWIFVKTIIDKIFQDTSFKYYSEFFETDEFKSLIYQGDINGLTLDDTEIAALAVVAEKTGTTNYSSVGSARTSTYCYTNYPVIFDSEILDPATQYDNTTGLVTIDTGGFYEYQFSFEADITNIGVVDFPNGRLVIKVGLVNSSGTILALDVVNIPPSQVFNLGVGSSTAIPIGMNFSGVRFDAADTFKLAILECSIYVGTQVQTLIQGVNTRLDVKANSSFYIQPQPQTFYGQTVRVNNLLDTNKTQKDFLMDLVKMFNLYIEPYWFREGDDNSGKFNQYLIEPRDEYFIDEVIDWTYNLDTEKDFTIKPNALVDSKFYYFSYKKDVDLLNNTYEVQTGRIYGDYVHDIDNDFTKGTKKIEIGISPTLMSSTSQLDHWNRVMPVIKSVTGEPTINSNPRILFYNGLKDSTWNFNGTYKTQYPLASNFDNWEAPTIDLNFAQPLVVYYKPDSSGQLTFTTGTLFNRYYYRQIAETTSLNSKMVECYIRLRPSDIHNLSFRPLYFIDNAYYRLYEVVDHNYTDTTLCRFLKIDVATPITNEIITSRGGRKTFTTNPTGPAEKAPSPDGKGGGGGETKQGFRLNPNIGIGTTGNPNTQIAGNNILQSGISRGYVIKDNLIDLGFQYMNVTSGATTLTGQEGSPLYVIADTTDGNVLLYLPDETLYAGSVIHTKKTVAGNQLQIYSSGDVLQETCSSINEVHFFLLTTDGIIKF